MKKGLVEADGVLRRPGPTALALVIAEFAIAAVLRPDILSVAHRRRASAVGVRMRTPRPAVSAVSSDDGGLVLCSRFVV